MKKVKALLSLFRFIKLNSTLLVFSIAVSYLLHFNDTNYVSKDKNIKLILNNMSDTYNENEKRIAA